MSAAASATGSASLGARLRGWAMNPWARAHFLWLIAIAYNEMRQMQRKRTHQNKIVAALSLEVHDGHAEAPEEVHDLPKVLAWLEEEERAAMLLSYMYGYSHREISLVTGLPVGTVKSKLNRARVRILERMNATVIQHV